MGREDRGDDTEAKLAAIQATVRRGRISQGAG